MRDWIADAAGKFRAWLRSYRGCGGEEPLEIMPAEAEEMAAKAAEFFRSCAPEAPAEARDVAMRATQVGADMNGTVYGQRDTPEWEAKCRAALEATAFEIEAFAAAQRREERERMLALVHAEEDATKAALESATGKWFEECLIAQKVLRHVAEKLAAVRGGGA